jgi:hypothetical protein
MTTRLPGRNVQWKGLVLRLAAALGLLVLLALGLTGCGDPDDDDGGGGGYVAQQTPPAPGPR